MKTKNKVVQKNKAKSINKIVVGFVGKICSGKGVATEYLAKKYSADTILFSESMRDCLARIYQPTTRENMQKISLILRQNFGQDIFSQTVFEDVVVSKKKVIAIDGIRRIDDIKTLTKLPKFILVQLVSPAEMRFARLKKRKQNPGEAKIKWEQFMIQDNAETEETITAVAKKAKYTISNSGSLKDFYSEIDKILSKEKMK